MTKSELIQAIAKKYSYLTIKELRILIDVIFEKITDELQKGNRVEIRGFGSISVRKRKPVLARNPRTNEIIPLGERSVIYFRMSKYLKKKLNPSNDI